MEIRVLCPFGRTIACTLVVVMPAPCALTPAPETPLVVTRVQSLASFERTLAGNEAATLESQSWVRFAGDALTSAAS